MGKQRKGATRVAEDPEAMARHPLQAILLADSFTTKFRPITLERPKVLLPLVNVPMIDYTLSWLESAGVEEVFVVCCAHSRQVVESLEKSEWFSAPNFTVTTIESHNSVSAGDALRVIYERNVIHGDFVLVSGDTVSNMSLSQAIQEHKERRKNDNNAVMTMVVKRSKPSPVTHQSRLGTDELFMAVDSQTKQLVYYVDGADHLKGVITLDNMLLADSPSISLHSDLQDCYIDICSPEVLSLFADNFDYQHLRRDFVKGLLDDDIMGYKVFTHEIDHHSSYAARIDSYRSYDTVSKDIIQRGTYPFVPDVIGDCAVQVGREGVYRASEIEQSRSAQIGPFTVVGKGTRIGNNTEISNSVIGNGCTIGSNVSIVGCYVWDNVTVEDGCELRHSIICDRVIVKSGAVLQPGVVLSFKVVVGPQFSVPAYSKASLLQQPTSEDSDEELEYPDNNSANVDSRNVDSFNGEIVPESSDLGNGGVGYIWWVPDDEWKHSVAPIPADKLAWFLQSIEDDSDSDIDDDSRDDTFEKEVEATFLRAVDENIKVGDVILEMNSLRLSYNMTTTDCAGEIFFAMMKLALENARAGNGELQENVSSVVNRELQENVTNVVTKWQELLKFYVKDIDDQIEIILKFEEMCQESAEEFSGIVCHVLDVLYQNDVVEEDAVYRWADEKKDADESDKVIVKKAEQFIQWLKVASEEEN